MNPLRRRPGRGQSRRSSSFVPQRRERFALRGPCEQAVRTKGSFCLFQISIFPLKLRFYSKRESAFSQRWTLELHSHIALPFSLLLPSVSLTPSVVQRSQVLEAENRRDRYLHFSQVLHASGDLPRERDQVAHGKSPVVGVLQVAGVTVGIPAHVARANFPTLTQEVAQRAVLGVLHDQVQRTYLEKYGALTPCAKHVCPEKQQASQQVRSHRPGCTRRTSL